MWQVLAKFVDIGRIDDLPENIQASIRRQQENSEKLVSVIQLAVLCVFSVLYMASPKPQTLLAMAQPVPWFLSAYLLFTVIRLRLSFKHRLPDGLISASVIADMALLMGMIWSFHIQYDQPPSFYLKAPTLLYVFIFIALRALRFEVRYIVLSGVVAAVGWLLMLLYAAWFHTPDMPLITRDYVQYMTSNYLLIGAEIDKIISILLVTTILALAVMRARVMLVRSVRETAAAKSLSRFFDTDVARRIADGGEALTPGTGVARDAAILSVDIRGFTPLTRSMTPGQLVRFITEYQARMVPAVVRHGGAIDKFLGDGLLVTFGAVRKSATCAADALRAIDDLMLAAEAWNRERAARGEAPVRIGAGAASGSVVCGVIGEAGRLEYTVLGDAVNVSAKLESHTKTEAVRALVSAALYETALAQGYEPKDGQIRLSGRTVGGIEGPMDIVVMAK